jgi:hypothetical protein
MNLTTQETDNQIKKPSFILRRPIVSGILISVVISAIAIGIFFFGFTKIDSTETDLKIKGNRNSHIYHLKECPNYDDIATRNIVWFKTEEEAKKRRFRKAENCGF